MDINWFRSHFIVYFICYIFLFFIALRFCHPWQPTLWLYHLCLEVLSVHGNACFQVITFTNYTFLMSLVFCSSVSNPTHPQHVVVCIFFWKLFLYFRYWRTSLWSLYFVDLYRKISRTARTIWLSFIEPVMVFISFSKTFCNQKSLFKYKLPRDF